MVELTDHDDLISEMLTFKNVFNFDLAAGTDGPSGTGSGNGEIATADLITTHIVKLTISPLEEHL